MKQRCATCRPSHLLLRRQFPHRLPDGLGQVLPQRLRELVLLKRHIAFVLFVFIVARGTLWRLKNDVVDVILDVIVVLRGGGRRGPSRGGDGAPSREVVQ